MTERAAPIGSILLGDPWFARQSETLRTALLLAGRCKSLGPEEWLYGAGDEDTGICAVLEGALRIEVAADDRRAVLVNVLTPGIVIGQSRRLGGGPRIVTARAAGASTVWLVSDQALQRISQELPDTWRAVAELLYRQLADAMQRTGDLLALHPRERVITRLRRLAPTSAGEWAGVTLTQTDIAEMVGLSRKSVSAHLLALQRTGDVRLRYGRIEVRGA